MLVIRIKKRVGNKRHHFDLDLNLNLPANARKTVFFGPSGSGKTLTMRCLAGLVTPDQGFIEAGEHVLFDSEKKINILPQKRHVGYMPQDYGLFPHLTLIENVAYPKTGFLTHMIGKKEKAASLSLLKRFGLVEYARNLPSELSGGQKQRASLARALNSQPDFLLLDEPFSALDPLLRINLRADMLALLDTLRLPLVVITHDPDDVDAFGQTVILFRQGRAKMVPDYQQARKNFSSAASCLLTLQDKLWASQA